MSSTPCILLIDDHALFRVALRRLIDIELPGARVLECDSLVDAVALAGVDVRLVLLDLGLPGLNGLDGMGLVRSRWPQARIVVVSGNDQTSTVQEASRLGAHDFISKAAPVQQIQAHIARALAGQPSETADTRAAAVRGPSGRQLEVLALLCTGLPNKAIGRRLDVSAHTVRNHLVALMKHFGATTRTELMAKARRSGLV